MHALQNIESLSTDNTHWCALSTLVVCEFFLLQLAKFSLLLLFEFEVWNELSKMSQLMEIHFWWCLEILYHHSLCAKSDLLSSESFLVSHFLQGGEVGKFDTRHLMRSLQIIGLFNFKLIQSELNKARTLPLFTTFYSGRLRTWILPIFITVEISNNWKCSGLGFRKIRSVLTSNLNILQCAPLTKAWTLPIFITVCHCLFS